MSNPTDVAVGAAVNLEHPGDPAQESIVLQVRGWELVRFEPDGSVVVAGKPAGKAPEAQAALQAWVASERKAGRIAGP